MRPGSRRTATPHTGCPSNDGRAALPQCLKDMPPPRTLIFREWWEAKPVTIKSSETARGAQVDAEAGLYL